MMTRTLFAGALALALFGCEDLGTSGGAASDAGGAPSGGDGGGANGGGGDRGGGNGGGGGAGIGSIAIVDTCDVVRDEDGSLHTFEADIPWATLGGQQLLMNVARPKTPGPHPLVVFVHGGGWSSGERTWYDPSLRTVAANGYVAATIDYRLSTDDGTRFPVPVQDVRCAVRWLRANAASYGIDPDRIALVGGSAGGHLAALVGLSAGDAAFDGECPATASAEVSSVVALYGPFDLRASAYGGHEVGQWNVELLLGSMASSAPDAAAQASPLLYVDADDPPVLLTHGDKDVDVPLTESETFLAALQAAGVPSALVTVEGGEHGYDPDSPWPEHQRSTCTFFRFLEDTLGD